MHLTGHKSFVMVQRYAHLAPDFQAEAIARLNTYGTIRAQSPDEGQNMVSPNGRNPQVSLRVSMVGTAGIEPATPAMSMQCSPAELRALIAQVYSEIGVFGKPRG